METFLLEWLNILVRWAHIVLGVAWIGTSFFFVALDFSLRKRERMGEGLAGSSWHVHGGGFYNMEKYMVAPQNLPDDLIWYKYEAYFTWITGFILLILVYYFNASTYLIDPDVVEWMPRQAIAISIASLAAGWLIYDRILCRTRIGQNTTLLALSTFTMVLGACFLYENVFSGRGALIHIGALIGTIMAFNVFAIIIPNQRKITASLLKGEAPDPKLGLMGRQRSLHNTYFTLPVLLMMVSGHYPLLTTYQPLWLLVATIIVGGAAARHFFIKHDAHAPFGDFAWTVPVAFVALLAALFLTWPRAGVSTGGEVAAVSDLQALQITEKHCVACHVTAPSHESFDTPPKGIVLQNVSDLQRYNTDIMSQAVRGKAMPMGNETGMTDAERKTLGKWLAQQ